jgi:hypothetical protein
MNRAMRWSSIVVLGVLAACAACSGEATNPDAAVAVQADAAACATPADCPCFTNYDCPPTHACKTNGSLVACVAGPRGTGRAGVPCTSEQDCASALCVEDSEGGHRCSDLCRMAEMCPMELPRCVVVNGEGICSPTPPSS